MDFLTQSAYFGAALSLAAYGAGTLLHRRFRHTLVNPLLISVILCIAVLALTGVSYETYDAGAKYLSWFLTPATVCLAVPLYEKLALLRENRAAVLLGILSGVLTTLLCVLAMALLFRLPHRDYVTLLPKSVTTAIGMGISEELGGHVTLTAAIIIITGLIGNIFAPLVCRLCRIDEPIARGVAIGSSAHGIGTARAMEMGSVVGAMSGLSIAVSGLLTVVLAPLFARLL